MKASQKRGRGFLNKIINQLPFEAHLPGYQYCGPGTKVVKRLARGDSGINKLDAACKEHDIAYMKNSENLSARHEADKELASQAWKRAISGDAKFGERAASWAITNAMKAKLKLGASLRRKGGRKPSMSRKTLTSLNKIIKASKKSMLPSANSRIVIASALKGARKAVKTLGGKQYINIPRILPIPSKIGGFLPFLIPVFAGLSAAGAIAGGVAGITKAVNDASATKHQLHESQRHNRTMESIALGKGLHLSPYKGGMGLYLKPYKAGAGLKHAKNL